MWFMVLPYTLSSPRVHDAALLISSPHSGRDYLPSFLAASQLNAHDIRRSEDMFVDDLFSDAPLWGATLLAARYPRCYVDLNRAPDEWDMLLFKETPPLTNKTPYTAAGLGIVPRMITPHLPIYSGTISHTEAQSRVDEIYHPYHAALRETRAAIVAHHNMLVLLDVHSMPDKASEGVDIAIGNLHGTSASDFVSQWVADMFAQQGFRVGVNHPFAGGYIVGQYGAPHDNIHAIQIEINRKLYMNESTYKKTANFPIVQKQMTQMLNDLRLALPQFINPRIAAQ